MKEETGERSSERKVCQGARAKESPWGGLGLKRGLTLITRGGVLLQKKKGNTLKGRNEYSGVRPPEKKKRIRHAPRNERGTLV